jgi:hypothetical protein
MRCHSNFNRDGIGRPNGAGGRDSVGLWSEQEAGAPALKQGSRSGAASVESDEIELVG